MPDDVTLSEEKINRDLGRKNLADETEMVLTRSTQFNVQMDAGWTKVYHVQMSFRK